MPNQARPMPWSKTCAKCGTEKTTIHFHRKASSRDGLQSWCKECFSTRNRATETPRTIHTPHGPNWSAKAAEKAPSARPFSLSPTGKGLTLPDDGTTRHTCYPPRDLMVRVQVAALVMDMTPEAFTIMAMDFYSARLKAQLTEATMEAIRAKGAGADLLEEVFPTEEVAP